MTHKIILAAIILALAGCMGYTKKTEFVRWVDEHQAGGRQVVVRAGIAECTLADGSIESMPVPQTTPEEQAAEVAVAGVRRAVETGSPWPAVGSAASALSILLGGYAYRARRRAVDSTRRADLRESQARVLVEGVAASPPEAGRAVARTIKTLSTTRGIENGPDGLQAFVEAAKSNVLTEKPSGSS